MYLSDMHSHSYLVMLEPRRKMTVEWWYKAPAVEWSQEKTAVEWRHEKMAMEWRHETMAVECCPETTAVSHKRNSQKVLQKEIENEKCPQ